MKKYCKSCGSGVHHKDNFCGDCGTKQKAKSKKNTTEKHVLPAIFSFIIPSLGQFIKGDLKLALSILAWFFCGNGIIYAVSEIAGPVKYLLFIGFNSFLWIYQLHDAYNSPHK